MRESEWDLNSFGGGVRLVELEYREMTKSTIRGVIDRTDAVDEIVHMSVSAGIQLKQIVHSIRTDETHFDLCEIE